MNRLIPMGIALLLAGASVHADDTAAAATQSTPEPAQAREPVNCLKETGSRIKPNTDRPCVGGPGQVYTREDIDRTGATTTAEALRRLSPSVH